MVRDRGNGGAHSDSSEEEEEEEEVGGEEIDSDSDQVLGNLCFKISVSDRITVMRILIQLTTLMRIRILVLLGADPDHDFYSMRIRIQLFTLMRIRIQLVTLMRIRDPVPF
jgi:hypothetical protein